MIIFQLPHNLEKYILTNMNFNFKAVSVIDLHRGTCLQALENCNT